MGIIRNGFSYILSLLTSGVCFITVGKLIQFLSAPVKHSLSQTWFYNLLDNREMLKEIANVLGTDAALAFIFILSHSLFKLDRVKAIWSKYGLEDWSRNAYNLISCTTLLYMIHHWRYLPGITVWSFNVTSSNAFYWTYFAMHGLCWIIICCGSLLVDLPELLGFKQVYCKSMGIPCPNSQKTVELRRLLGHIRHPSFIGITIVLWAVNTMTADRLFLAALWTTYMYIAWIPDAKDVAYQGSQLSRKKYELTSQFLK